MKKFIKEALPYIVILLLVFIIRTFIVTPAGVDGPSMQETLYTNDIVLINKLNKNNVQRYDILVVKYKNERLVKRLIAMPGETIKCEEGIIYINGEEKSNEYGYGKNIDFSEVKLGDDEYFVIGDNRSDSFDSRFFGPIKKDKIIGTTNFIIFPFNRFGKVN